MGGVLQYLLRPYIKMVEGVAKFWGKVEDLDGLPMCQPFVLELEVSKYAQTHTHTHTHIHTHTHTHIYIYTHTHTHTHINTHI
jgi:hypothetical protein